MAAMLSLELVLMMGVGVLLNRLHIVKDDFAAQLSSVVMNVVLPCMIVSSMVGTLSAKELLDCAWLVVMALVLLAVLFAIGHTFFLIEKKSVFGRVLRFGFMFSNFTFMGVPVIQLLYGERLSAYFMVFLIPVRMLFYYCSQPMMKGPSSVEERHSVKGVLKSIFTPMMVAIIIAVVMSLAGLELPGVLYDVMKSIGAMCTPLGMIICGISFSRYSPLKLLRPYQLWVVAMRNLVLPGLCLAACMLFRIEADMARIAVVYTCLPISTMTNAFTVRYHPDDIQAQFECSGAVLATTIASIATIPLWAWLLGLVYP